MSPRRLAPLARMWGGVRAEHDERPGSVLVDLLLLAGLAGLFYGLTKVSREWTGALRPSVTIDLSPWSLPRYAFFSFSRGLFAYLLSFAFTLTYATWAAKDALAERVLLPLLDVLQSIPVLGFMPGLVLALVTLFPNRNVGLEMAAVLMIFTGQAWNMAFAFYHALRAVPRQQLEVATLYRFGAFRCFRRVELPSATTSLVWNSMMSVAGGWFFLMINEAFTLGDQDFRLPGLGSYMSVAAARGDVRAMLAAMTAMVALIVVLDQLVFRPLVVWAQKFRVEESGSPEVMSSWCYDVVRRSRLLQAFRAGLERLARSTLRGTARPVPSRRGGELVVVVQRLVFGLLVGVLLVGTYRLVHIFRVVALTTWVTLLGEGLLTLGRVLLATLVGTLWALPAGLAVGLSPRLSRVVQPIAQVFASFPAPMLFPAVIALLRAAHVGLGWGSIALMLLGTQWYIFFNVIAGAVAVPADLREVARSYRFDLRRRLRAVYLPAVFPALITGWVTAAGGAWNASIVAEYVSLKGQAFATAGLGAAISRAAEHAEFPRLAAAVTVMSVLVVVWNRTVWHACYRLAERRFALNK